MRTLPTDCRQPVPVARLIELRLKMLSYREIGRIVGLAHNTVLERLQPYTEHVDGLASFKASRGDILALHQSRLLMSVTDEDIKKMAPRDRYLCAGLMYDKERLEVGKSTSNIATITVSAAGLQRRLLGEPPNAE
jgi:hypothetical protein